MGITPRDVKRPNAKRLLIAAAILAFFAAFVPVSAYAGCCVTTTVTDTTTTPAVSAFQGVQTGLLAGLNGIFTALSTFLSTVFTFLQEALIGAISSATTSSGMLISDMLTKHGDYVVNSLQTIHQQHLTAVQQANATMSNQSMACAVQGYLQAKEQMYHNAHGINGSFTALIALGECKGVNASCSTSGRVRERFYDLCYLGFLPKQKYGDMLTTLDCGDITTQSGGQRYIDAQSNVNILFDYDQFPAIQGCILQDGYPYFSGKAFPGMTGGCQSGTTMTAPPALTGDPTQDPMAWVAAYKFCEGLKGTPKTPISTGGGRAITLVDMQRVLEDTEEETMNLAGSPYELCKHYLWERTAYGSGSNANATAVGGDTGNTDQMNLCQIMNASPNAGGVDLAGTNGIAQILSAAPGSTGLGLNDSPLVNKCVTANAGISPLAAMQAEAYKCGSPTHHAAQAANAASAATHESDSIGPCLHDATAYQKYVDHEKETLLEVITESRAVQGVGETATGSGEPANTGVGDVPLSH